MTFLPIVGRELRVAARRQGTYWSRAVTALGAIIIGGFMQIVNRSDAPYEFGRNLFEALSWISIFYCLFSGVRATADCLSEEKREGTLGLLFLTDLKGYDVVFGKLAATSLGAFYGLLAIFPVLAVPLLMGGITNQEFWRMALVLVNTFVFSLAVGMFVSSVSKSSRKAMAGTFLLILLFTAVAPGLVEWVPVLSRVHGLENAVFLVWPFSPFRLSFDAAYRADPHSFWTSCELIHGLAWLFLILASLITPRSWQDKPSGGARTRWRDVWHQWNYGGAAERHAFRRRLLDINAFYWLASRARLKPAHVWAFLGIAACFWAWGCVELGRDWFNDGTYVITALVINTGLKLWVASEAGHRLGEDRKIGSLELLLSTPLNVPDILRGQLLALGRQFLAPVLAVLGVELTFMLVSLRDQSYRVDTAYVAFWVLSMLMLVIDLVALSWVGMWVALTTRHPNQATSITVARLLVLPWVILIAFAVLLSVISVNGSSSDEMMNILLGLWFGLGTVADIAFGLSARANLRAAFRVVATQRFTPGRPQPGPRPKQDAAPSLPPVGAEIT